MKVVLALLALLAASLVQPVISSAVKGVSRGGDRRAGRGGVKKIGRWYMDNIFHSLSNIEINNYFNYKPRINGVFFKKDFTYNKRWSVCHKSRW